MPTLKNNFKNCRFGPSHHRLKSHMMFISMQHVLLGVGWEVDGVNLNAMLGLTLADLQLLFATCKPHPPSQRMLISPFPHGNTSFWTNSCCPFFFRYGKCSYTKVRPLQSFPDKWLWAAKYLPLIWLSAAFFEQVVFELNFKHSSVQVQL